MDWQRKVQELELTVQRQADKIRSLELIIQMLTQDLPGTARGSTSEKCKTFTVASPLTSPKGHDYGGAPFSSFATNTGTGSENGKEEESKSKDTDHRRVQALEATVKRQADVIKFLQLVIQMMAPGQSQTEKVAAEGSSFDYFETVAFAPQPTSISGIGSGTGWNYFQRLQNSLQNASTTGSGIETENSGSTSSWFRNPFRGNRGRNDEQKREEIRREAEAKLEQLRLDKERELQRLKTEAAEKRARAEEEAKRLQRQLEKEMERKRREAQFAEERRREELKRQEDLNQRGLAAHRFQLQGKLEELERHKQELKTREELEKVKIEEESKKRKAMLDMMLQGKFQDNENHSHFDDWLNQPD